MTTGEKIKQLRKTANMSQEKLADSLGLSRQAVSRWETDNAIPETSVILKLSELFHVTTDYLLKVTETENPENREREKDTSIKVTWNLIIGITGVSLAALSVFALSVLSRVIPYMRDGTYGMLDPNFWTGNGMVPFAVIIVLLFIVGAYYLIKYYLSDT